MYVRYVTVLYSDIQNNTIPSVTPSLDRTVVGVFLLTLPDVKDVVLSI